MEYIGFDMIRDSYFMSVETKLLEHRQYFENSLYLTIKIYYIRKICYFIKLVCNEKYACNILEMVIKNWFENQCKT